MSRSVKCRNTYDAYLEGCNVLGAVSGSFATGSDTDKKSKEAAEENPWWKLSRSSWFVIGILTSMLVDRARARR